MVDSAFFPFAPYTQRIANMMLAIKIRSIEMKAKKTLALIVVVMMALWVPHCDLINGEEDDDQELLILAFLGLNQATINLTNNSTAGSFTL